MRLVFQKFDSRKIDYVPVIDQNTGQCVGDIMPSGTGFERYGGIDIALFDGKYCLTAHTYEECVGFVKGVEAVLNHMVAIERPVEVKGAA